MKFHAKKRIYFCAKQMVDKCQHMISQAEPLRRRFLAAHAHIMDLYGSSEELSRVCASFGIKQGTKKWTKAVDGFAWNMRLLTGQADIMQQAREECKLSLRQICEAAAATGLLVSSPPPQQQTQTAAGAPLSFGSANNSKSSGDSGNATINTEESFSLQKAGGDNVNGNVINTAANNKVVVDI